MLTLNLNYWDVPTYDVKSLKATPMILPKFAPLCSLSTVSYPILFTSVTPVVVPVPVMPPPVVPPTGYGVPKRPLTDEEVRRVRTRTSPPPPMPMAAMRRLHTDFDAPALIVMSVSAPIRTNPPRAANDPNRIIHYGQPGATDAVSREVERIRIQANTIDLTANDIDPFAPLTALTPLQLQQYMVSSDDDDDDDDDDADDDDDVDYGFNMPDKTRLCTECSMPMPEFEGLPARSDGKKHELCPACQAGEAFF